MTLHVIETADLNNASPEGMHSTSDHPLVLLAVFAHPDDETFRCGGTLALLARAGVRVHLLTVTHGEQGSCGEPPLCRAEDLPAVRERELRCACKALGIEAPRVWNYPDGGLNAVKPEQLTGDIFEVVREVEPQVILSFGPDGLSGHPDHIAVGRCAAAAFDRAGAVAALYTIAVPHSLAAHLGLERVRSVPDESISLAVDVSAVWEAKWNAMHCHATQASSSPMLRASAERQRAFFGVEHFVRAACRRPEQDILATMFT